MQLDGDPSADAISLDSSASRRGLSGNPSQTGAHANHGRVPCRSSTFVDLLRWRATHQPGRRAYTFLLAGEQREGTLDYAELDRQARAIAAALQDLDPT